MIRASDLLDLKVLPPHATDTLQRMMKAGGDLELHLPGLPAHLPNIPMNLITGPAKDALIAALGNFDFVFYQEMGVSISMKGSPLVSLGAKLSEGLNVKSPVPNVHLTPVLHLGVIKE